MVNPIRDGTREGTTAQKKVIKRKQMGFLSVCQKKGSERIKGKPPRLDSDEEEENTRGAQDLTSSSLGYLTMSPRKVRSQAKL